MCINMHMQCADICMLCLVRSQSRQPHSKIAMMLQMQDSNRLTSAHLCRSRVLKDCETGKAQWTVEASASMQKCFVGTQFISALSSFQVGCSMHVLVPSQMGCEVHGLNKVNRIGQCKACHILQCRRKIPQKAQAALTLHVQTCNCFSIALTSFQCIPRHLCSHNMQALILEKCSCIPSTYLSCCN